MAVQDRLRVLVGSNVGEWSHYKMIRMLALALQNPKNRVRPMGEEVKCFTPYICWKIANTVPMKFDKALLIDPVILEVMDNYAVVIYKVFDQIRQDCLADTKGEMWQSEIYSIFFDYLRNCTLDMT